jgi:hypothetical protein
MVLPGLFNYWVVVVLMRISFYVVIAHRTLVKKIFRLNRDEHDARPGGRGATPREAVEAEVATVRRGRPPEAC